MKRLSAAALAVLLLWALAPAVGEFVENAAHLLLEGHLAHAAPDGDHHDPAGAEHGCSGAVHLCSCCVSLGCLPSRVPAHVAARGSEVLPATVATHVSGQFRPGVYHPPRA